MKAIHNNLTIESIQSVYRGKLNVGVIKKDRGRHSDAFVLYLSGETKYTFADYSFTAFAGDIIYLSHNSLYNMDIRKDGVFICADFNFLFPKNENFSTVAVARKSCVFRNISPTIENSFEKLLRFNNKVDFSEHAYCMAKLYEVYAACLSSVSKKYSGYSKRFAELSNYVSENYADPTLSVASLANHAGLSEVQTRRIFSAHANVSPLKYITFSRLEKAKFLLSETNMTVSEISESVGFTDAYYFSRLFKKEIGVTPTQFRNAET